MGFLQFKEQQRLQESLGPYNFLSTPRLQADGVDYDEDEEEIPLNYYQQVRNISQYPNNQTDLGVLPSKRRENEEEQRPYPNRWTEPPNYQVSYANNNGLNSSRKKWLQQQKL